jgi:segregation and condensation protein A
MTDRSDASPDTFEDPVPPRQTDQDFVLRLESYEGPIDVLLEQAREQKVDLTQISILQLADQYLTFVERARRLRLELAADYLVMAAWLAYLKSRLLLPQPDAAGDEPTGEELAAALAFQLRRLEAMREAGRKLTTRPQLGIDMFPRGAPEPLGTQRTPVYQVSLYDLLKVYAENRRKVLGAPSLRVEASELFSMDVILKRLSAMLGGTKDWADLLSFLPQGLGDPLTLRSAIAATLAASLELAKAGKAELHQDGTFRPIYVRHRQRQWAEDGE